MRTPLLLALLGSLGAASCADDCEVREATGLFTLFQSEGCSTTDGNVSAEDGISALVSHDGNVITVDGLDTVQVWFPGRQYVGRQGSCFLTDADVSNPRTLAGHCDYAIRDFQKTSDTESTWTVELLDVYAEAYGNQGTLKALLRMQSFDQGFSP